MEMKKYIIYGRNAIRHFKTVCEHKKEVAANCFRVGLYWQGITHDLSKFSPVEFAMGAKYYQGTRSPNVAERLDRGYSSAWLHHKGKNKHHLEYWLDYDENTGGTMSGMKMPVRYVVEMFCDRVAANKVYKKEAYHDGCPWEYYVAGKSKTILHPESAKLLETLLCMLKEKGEKKTFLYIRKKVLKRSDYFLFDLIFRRVLRQIKCR